METKTFKSSEYHKVVNDLLNSEIVGFPTETVYGLAIVYNDKKAFERLYEVKNRSINKPISMMVANISAIEEVAYVDEKAKKIIDAFILATIIEIGLFILLFLTS